MASLLAKLGRLWRHRSADEAAVRRVLPPEVLARLQARVAASERRHTGEIRLCIEAGLPTSYLWRGAPARERAIMLFGKLRVWDTEHNNGVLIYLLLAEHAIEIVADRGLHQHVNTAQWQAMLARMATAFRDKRYEDGLTRALEEISALLVAHFAVNDSTGGPKAHPNELPDTPLLL